MFQPRATNKESTYKVTGGTSQSESSCQTKQTAAACNYQNIVTLRNLCIKQSDTNNCHGSSKRGGKRVGKTGRNMWKKHEIRIWLDCRNPLIWLLSGYIQSWKLKAFEMFLWFCGENATRHWKLQQQGQEDAHRSVRNLLLAWLSFFFLSILPLARFSTNFLITKHNVPQQSHALPD